MGPSGAFLGILFFSGALGKGGLENPQGQRAGTGTCGWRMERELTEVKRSRELLGHGKAEARGAGRPGQHELCQTVSKDQGEGEHLRITLFRPHL